MDICLAKPGLSTCSFLACSSFFFCANLNMMQARYLFMSHFWRRFKLRVGCVAGRYKMSSVFEWPWQYSFPPFFTIQPNSDTREKQLEAWCNLVLSYCKYTRDYVLDVKAVVNSPLFNNQSINHILYSIIC